MAGSGSLKTLRSIATETARSVFDFLSKSGWGYLACDLAQLTPRPRPV